MSDTFGEGRAIGGSTVAAVWPRPPGGYSSAAIGSSIGSSSSASGSSSSVLGASAIGLLSLSIAFRAIP